MVGLLISVQMLGAQEESVAEPVVEPAVVLEPLPERMWSRYFGVKPKPFLVDPQRLMHARDFRERNDFLKYHSSDSKIDLWFYLFKENQEIPEGAEAGDMAQRFFNEGKPVVIVFYYIGQPQRTSLVLSPSLADVVPLADRDRALSVSVKRAEKDAVATKQFERFMLQMSIQLYWMEQLLGDDANPEADDEDALLGSAVTQEGGLEESWEVSAWQWLQASWVFLLVGGFLVLSLAVWRVWLMARASYEFPEIEVEPRLGGDHAAGVGAVISFASSSVSPAAQREQAPEYMKRL